MKTAIKIFLAFQKPESCRQLPLHLFHLVFQIFLMENQNNQLSILRILLFSTFDSKTTEAKNIFMAVFIVLWPYLLTTKLRSVILHNIGHSKCIPPATATQSRNSDSFDDSGFRWKPQWDLLFCDLLTTFTHEKYYFEFSRIFNWSQWFVNICYWVFR